MHRTAVCLCLCLLVSGCGLIATPPVPTVSSITMQQTAIILTQNAPPPGFEQSVQFAKIDGSLDNLTSWHYTVSLAFDGTFTDTGDKATGEIDAEVFSNVAPGERRVLLKASGAAFDLKADRNVEGVRIRSDYYLVDQNKVCTKTTEPAPGQVADLTASALIGGVQKATPAGQRKTDGKVDLWEYSFSPDSVVPPTLQVAQGGSVTIAAGDLWVAPSAGAVWQYTITLNVANVLLQGKRPLTGQIHAAYQLVETGTTYNISIPFGC
jgi:hypothetical protein